MNYLDNIIGQNHLKSRLEIYAQNYTKTGVLPFLLLCSARGAGKTKLIREFRKTLKREDGSTPPILEINCAGIKSAHSFLDQVYPLWTGERAVLFLDEVHLLPQKLQDMFLTVLEKDNNPIRRLLVDYGSATEEFEFDFTKISVICATTNHEKLGSALDDRLTKVSLAEYNQHDLMGILKLNTKVEICQKIEDSVKSIFRGHPRDCVEIAENIEKFAMAKSISKMDEETWPEFCRIMGINDHGFNDAEIQIIRVIGDKGGECSLEAISASTGFSKGVIRQRYEHALLKSGIIDIVGKRQLSKLGREFYKKIQVGA